MTQQRQESRKSEFTPTSPTVEKIETGGKLYLKILQEKDIDFVFGTTGAGMADIQDAMVVVKPPKWIQGLHEFPTVNAAAGYALATENFGVALIDRSVGTANAVGAFYCTYMTSAPIVVFASVNVPGVPMENSEIEYHYITDEATLLGPWIKWHSSLNSLDTLEDDISKAIFAARSEQQGPVYYTLRQDLMAKTLSEEEQNKFRSLPEKERTKERTIPSYRIPDDLTIERIASEVLSHSMPQIVVSHLGRHRAYVKSLVDFAHRLGISVLDIRSFMNFPTNDTLHVGFTQPTKPPKIEPNIDLVISLEAGLLPNFKYPGNADVIDLTSDPLHIQDVMGGGNYGSSMISTIVSTVCDVGPTLEKITRLVSEKIDSQQRERIQDRSERAKSMHEEVFGKARQKAEESIKNGKLDASAIGKVMNDNWSRNTVWVDGTWTPKTQLLSLVETTEPGSYFTNPSGHLGSVLGMAYGVALAGRHYVDVRGKEDELKVGKISHSTNPNVTICTTGDGDAIFGNMPSALWTCAHYGIGVVYVILNNSCWAIEWPPIEMSTMHWAKKYGDFEFLDLDRPNISYTEIAHGLQVDSVAAGTPEEFDQALRAGIKNALNDRPFVIDARMEKFTGDQPSSVP